MRKSFLVIASVVSLFSLTSCKGYDRQMAVANADNYGADWIVAQDSYDGHVYRCWKLHDTSVATEEHSEGIHWLDNSGHIVHISGWYNRVSVSNSNWEDAAKQIDVDLTKCHES